MTEFICISRIIDAVEFANEETRESQLKSYEYLKDRTRECVISQRVQSLAEEIVSRRDEVYRVFVKELRNTEYVLADKESVKEAVNSCVSVTTLHEHGLDAIPESIDDQLSELREFLKNNHPTDPYEIMKNIRKNTMKRKRRVIEYLDERVGDAGVSGDHEFADDIRARVEKEVSAQTYVDALAWHSPQRSPLPLAVGMTPMIEDCKDAVEAYFEDKVVLPRGVEFRNLDN